MPELPGWAYAAAAVVLAYAAFLLLLVATGRRAAAREAAMLLPNLIRLFHGLLGDPRVPWHAKVILGGGLVYLAVPVDLVPDFVPFAGQLDDAIVAALVLAYVSRSVGGDLVREHWHGDAAILARILRLT